MTKEDLKAGMYVVLENGDSGILMPWAYGLSGLEVFGYNVEDDSIHAISDAFIFTKHDDSLGYGIVKVYNSDVQSETDIAGFFSERGRTLVWEYDEGKELTVSEIEKLLGYKIKIVKEHV